MTKEEIIREIQRTAKENGGIPMGREKFHAVTNVKASDWFGKIWAKWNDAVEEAGFEPNQMNSAFDDEFLLDSYASLVRELGRVPTAPELRMKARNAEGFPSHNTFTRFGSKKHLLGKLIEYCSSQSEFEDVTPILKKEPHILSSDANEQVCAKDSVGYVYLIEFGSEYKIGNSSNVERRFRELKTQMPYEGKIIHTIETGDPEGIEAYWHQFFSEKRLKGEWFKLSKDDIKYFKKRKLM